MTVIGTFLVGCSNSAGINKSIYNQALLHCNSYIKDRLKSPSSMKVSKIDAVYMGASVEDIFDWLYKDANSREEMRNTFELYERLNYKPRKLAIVFHYEAQNSYGASIANESYCEYSVGNNSLEFIPLDGGYDTTRIHKEKLLGYFKKPSVSGDITLINDVGTLQYDDKKTRKDAYILALTRAHQAIQNAETKLKDSKESLDRAMKGNYSDRFKEMRREVLEDAQKNYDDLNNRFG